MYYTRVEAPLNEMSWRGTTEVAVVAGVAGVAVVTGVAGVAGVAAEGWSWGSEGKCTSNIF